MTNPQIKTIALGTKKIGSGQPPFVIAEAGVNHNGSVRTALKLVDAAARAKVDAIKFQTFKAEAVVIKSGKAPKDWEHFNLLKRLELRDSFYGPIIKRCRQKNILFLSTPHGGFESVDFLQKLGVSAFKFGSGDINNLPVLKYAARLDKPMILGTGMATMSEVKNAIKWIRQAGNKKIIVLHCTTNYPCPYDQVNLSVLPHMMKELDVLVGYSDHTLGSQVPVMAATLGACVIEKHFTLDRTMPGPDHKASIEPDELAEMVASVKKVKIIMGAPLKRPSQSEQVMARAVRKSIVASKNIRKGEKFTTHNIGVKRPGTGIEPKYYFKIIGKPAKKNISHDTIITTKDYDK